MCGKPTWVVFGGLRPIPGVPATSLQHSKGAPEGPLLTLLLPQAPAMHMLAVSPSLPHTHSLLLSRSLSNIKINKK